MYRSFLVAAASLALAGSVLAQDRTPAPDGAELYFVSPTSGDTISNPVTVVFGLKGMGVAPAGTEKEATGHHHLLVNTDVPALDEPIPADDNHVHFGGGQTQTEIELPPGEHTLQLLLGDLNHIPHDPPVMSEVITVTVE
ncbi:MAG: DUF4399 domain-containing protein [Geminicoccaceae bacterium]